MSRKTVTGSNGIFKFPRWARWACTSWLFPVRCASRRTQLGFTLRINVQGPSEFRNRWPIDSQSMTNRCEIGSSVYFGAQSVVGAGFGGAILRPKWDGALIGRVKMGRGARRTRIILPKWGGSLIGAAFRNGLASTRGGFRIDTTYLRSGCCAGSAIGGISMRYRCEIDGKSVSVSLRQSNFEIQPLRGATLICKNGTACSSAPRSYAKNGTGRLSQAHRILDRTQKMRQSAHRRHEVT